MTVSSMRIGILMEFDSEQGLEYIRILQKHSVPISAVIMIGHKNFPRAERLLYERTGGHYTKPWLSRLLSKSRIPVYFVDDVNSNDFVELLTSLQLDLVVAQSSRIIKVPVFNIPRVGILNCHTAILPYFRGCSCLEWSIYNDRPIGATCHFMIRKVDSGPRVYQTLLKYTKGDTYELIRTKMIYLMAEIMFISVSNIQKSHVSDDPKNAVVLDRQDINHNYQNNLQNNMREPWFSPMKDPNDIQMVKDKLTGHGRDGTPIYKPIPFPNQDDLTVTAIDIDERLWTN